MECVEFKILCDDLSNYIKSNSRTRFSSIKNIDEKLFSLNKQIKNITRICDNIIFTYEDDSILSLKNDTISRLKFIHQINKDDIEQISNKKSMVFCNDYPNSKYYTCITIENCDINISNNINNDCTSIDVFGTRNRQDICNILLPIVLKELETTDIISILTNNNIIHNIGTVYASEILFLSRINPYSNNSDNIDIVIKNIISVIYRFYSMGGLYNSKNMNRFLVYNKYECTFCGNKITRGKIYGKEIHYCEKCQK